MSIQIAVQNVIESIRERAEFTRLVAAETAMMNDPEAHRLAQDYNHVVGQLNQLTTHDSLEARALKQLASQAKVARDQLPVVREYLQSYQQFRSILSEVNARLFDEFIALHQGQTCVTRK